MHIPLRLGNMNDFEHYGTNLVKCQTQVCGSFHVFNHVSAYSQWLRGAWLGRNTSCYHHSADIFILTYWYWDILNYNGSLFTKWTFCHKISRNIEVARWLTYWARDKVAAICRLYFHIHFCEWKLAHIKQYFIKICSYGLVENMPVLVQILAWGRTGDKPLSELMT